MSEPIRVEIVTPVHNRRDITLQCLKSISNLNSEGLNIGVVILDDGSTDGTSEAIREQFPNVDVVHGTGDLWFTEGTNVAVRGALEKDPKYILQINDDQVFDADSLRYMVETAERYPRTVVGSLLLLWDVPHRLFQTAPVWDTWAGGWRHWYSQTIWTIPQRPWKVDIIVGNCVLVPVAAINEHGLMNSKRYPNFGDAEYTPRLKRAGWQLVIDPRARVFCQPNTPPSRLSKMSLRKMYDNLIGDLGKNHNLRRRLYASLDGAPSRIQGLAAFAAFLARAAVGSRPESDTWAGSRREEPLSELFAHATLD